jgi:hypothetical protein
MSPVFYKLESYYIPKITFRPLFHFRSSIYQSLANKSTQKNKKGSPVAGTALPKTIMIKYYPAL